MKLSLKTQNIMTTSIMALIKITVRMMILSVMTLSHINQRYIECSLELVHILSAKPVVLLSGAKTGGP